MTADDWVPTVDISETEAGYAILAELPGVKKDAVKVMVENGVVTIQGERRQEQTERSRVERSYGRFARNCRLPNTIDAGKVRAEFADGILHLHLLKSEKAKPKQIEVSPNPSTTASQTRSSVRN
jgi:HSP20 family protein